MQIEAWLAFVRVDIIIPSRRYVQEDMFLGDLRAFLDDAVLGSHDTISPLLAPFYHAGPFMVFRNSKAVNSLFRK